MHRKYVGFAAGGFAVALAANSALAQTFTAASPTIAYTAGTVNSFGNPAAVTAPSANTDAASNSATDGETLANFSTLITSAFSADTGGVINFEQADENGQINGGASTDGTNNLSPTYSWPSQNNSTTNGLTFGNIPNAATVISTPGTAAAPRAVQINYGFDQPTATQAYNGTTGDPGGVTASNTTQLVGGTNSIKFWRDLYQFTTNPSSASGNLAVPIGSTLNVPIGFKAISGGGTANQTNVADGFDANNGENNAAVLGTTPTSGNSYAGITNDGSPVVLDFSSNPLSAFGIEALGRGSTRPLTVHLTLLDGTVINSSTEANVGTGTAAIFFGFDLTATDLSAHGGIIYATLDVSTANPDRFDDLAFIVAPTPEPASLGLLGLGGLAMMRRRRKA